MGRKKELTLVAAKAPQLKKRAKRDWSKAKARAFIAALTDTCNVSEACRQSGVPMTVAYRRRKMDASFRAAWRDAIAIGYQRLEALLLERAFNGTEKIVTRKDGSEERVLEAEDMPDIGAGSLSIAFGNFKAGYVIAERNATTILRIPTPTSRTSTSTRPSAWADRCELGSDQAAEVRLAS